MAIPITSLSSASRRALAYTRGPEWFCQFRESDLLGDFAYEPGVIRRDPSSVLWIDGVYYCWYTRGEGASRGFDSKDPDAKVFPWDRCEVWYATSDDGVNWTERGRAVGCGSAGAYDDRSVFTPEMMLYEGRYYLVYQVVQAPYRLRSKEHVAMAIADCPHGPWIKLDGPILSPADNGVWRGEEDDRFAVEAKGDFDSHKTHDPCVLPYRGQFYLYYKGERMGEAMTFGGREIAWGVATSAEPSGPYVKSPYNPVTNSGHEVCIWPYRNGIAALLTTDGPEKNTIQYAEDGINFEIMSVLKSTPEALGLVRGEDTDNHPLAALRWGLCHRYSPCGKWTFIRRFESFFPSRV